MASRDPTHPDEVQKAKLALSQSMIHTLGQSVVSWSYIELAVDLIAGILLGKHGLRRLRAAKLISSNLEVREKAGIVVALAHDANIPRRDLERIIVLMNKVQNKLRTDRNRLFHDSWASKDGVLTRRQKTGSKILRPQSRRIELFLPEAKPVELKDLTTFLKECRAVADEIIDLAEKVLDGWAQDTPLPQPRQSPSPQTFWSRLRQYWR